VDKTKLEGIEINIKNAGSGDWMILLSVLSIAIPMLIFVWFFWNLSKQAKAGPMQANDFTKARARLFGAEGHPQDKILFKDVAGLKEAKEELIEIVDFLKNPEKYLKMGAKIPKGVLLVGPAGVGKTMLARATAGESNVPFFHISGSEFVELFVGVGAARVRSLFTEAKKKQPSIIFVDELDAIGKSRGPDKVIVLAACNRPDVLDPALLRAGRFDRKIMLELPDINERTEILENHAQNKPLVKSINLREIAERTPGFSGADLANLMNEAAILAARFDKKEIDQTDITSAFEKVLLGPEKKSKVLSKKEKEICAYHEAGHALVALNYPETGPVRKVSIIARGLTAGFTLKLPSEEKNFKTKEEFIQDIALLLGGYCAEKIIFGEVTTGASNDLERASEIARRLIKEYGMSELGPIVFGRKDQLTYFGGDFGEDKNYSENIAQEIDAELGKVIMQGQSKANEILKKKVNILKKIASALIEKETLEKEELEQLVKEK
jgi:cell division protease FtsH